MQHTPELRSLKAFYCFTNYSIHSFHFVTLIEYPLSSSLIENRIPVHCQAKSYQLARPFVLSYNTEYLSIIKGFVLFKLTR